MIRRFLGFGDKEANLVKRSMENIKKGEAITNIQEYEKAKLFKIRQFWKRK